MKIALFLLACCSSLRADLLANFTTSQGAISVKLLYNQAPHAVANFIVMSQGTRPHIEAATGGPSFKPFYIGEKFFRIVNTPTFKIAQTGSGNGTNAGGGPGYRFRDEFDPTLTHVPYVLSMANSGPNTNGTQIFLTGNVAILDLNNVHTIFGSITDPASRGVIDAILAAGDNGTTITGVSFSRTDPAAVAFDEFAQNLPICVGNTPGSLAAIPTVSATFNLKNPLQAGSVFQAFRSTNLVSWTKIKEQYQDIGSTDLANVVLDTAALPKAFYNLSTVRYQNALGPASLANRTLVVGYANATATITFQFNAAGTGGSAAFSNAPTTSTPITGVNFQPGPYSATWLISTAAYQPFQILGGFNSQTATQILGTQAISQPSGPFSSRGSLTLSR